jgi:hypothetical protein
MKRPQVIHFLSIKTSEFISIKTLISLTMESGASLRTRPIDSFGLLRSSKFSLRIEACGVQRDVLFARDLETDNLGGLYFKIPLTPTTKDIEFLQIYETHTNPGIEYHLGTYFPMVIEDPKKLVICDFDKTLLDTRYSTPKEIYNSLTKSLFDFPMIPGGIKLLKDNIKKGLHPFILSASPHFYEKSIRDWLYQQDIYSAGIFLKDYRQILSVFNEDLSPKDIKAQGLYKLNHLLDILLMVGIPKELVLIGDNYESDPTIYLCLAQLLEGTSDTLLFWNQLMRLDIFPYSFKQKQMTLDKIYQINSELKGSQNSNSINVSIFIRKKAKVDTLNIPQELEKYSHYASLFDAYDEGPKPNAQ